MQTLKASELFSNEKDIYNVQFDSANKIDIDFTDVKNIDLSAINILLNMQKVAILNNKKLYMSNVNPNVRQILDITGLEKTFVNYEDIIL